MLTAASSLALHDSRVRTLLALERGLRVHLTWRERLLVDSRFLAPGRPRIAVATVYVALGGSFQVDGGPVRDSSQLFVLHANEFASYTAKSASFRSWGDPAVTVEMQVAAEDIIGPIGLTAGPRPIAPQTWDALHALAEGSAEDAAPGPLVHTVVERLIADGVLAPRVLTRLVANEPERFLRLWRALASLYSRHATGTTLGELTDATGLSLRQLHRDLRELSRTFQTAGESFRDNMRVMRLRSATLWLSAPYVTVGEIAERVGYGTSDALARALRDAKLPPPSEIQAAVAYR